MKQPSNGKTPKVKKRTIRKKRTHAQEYGTSKLEEDFARDFLDKLGVKYDYQFKAEDIGRYYDFYLPEHRVLIEVDGDYYHSYGLVYEEMSPMQKKNCRVDEQKNKWALLHGIPIVRIWEHDIRKNPHDVMKRLKEVLYIADTKKTISEGKSRRHVNKMKDIGKK